MMAEISISTEVRLWPHWNQWKIHSGFQDIHEVSRQWDLWGSSGGTNFISDFVSWKGKILLSASLLKTSVFTY